MAGVMKGICCSAGAAACAAPAGNSLRFEVVLMRGSWTSPGGFDIWDVEGLGADGAVVLVGCAEGVILGLMAASCCASCEVTCINARTSVPHLLLMESHGLLSCLVYDAAWKIVKDARSKQ